MTKFLHVQRRTVVAVVLAVGLLFFEVFNFDTTRYALRDLIGPITFISIEWASMMAIAFCSIDFAGLVSLLTPVQNETDAKKMGYLMGAWLLGATMNALMSWWAVSISLVNHTFTEGVLTHAQVMKYVPILVATTVWLTRIMLIGSFSVAGEYFTEEGGDAAETTEETEELQLPGMPRLPRESRNSNSLGLPLGMPVRDA